MMQEKVRPVTWRPGVNRARPPLTVGAQPTVINTVSSQKQPSTVSAAGNATQPLRPAFKEAQVKPSHDLSRNQKQDSQDVIPPTQQKIIPRFKPTFKPNPTVSSPQPKQAGPRQAPSFKPAHKAAHISTAYPPLPSLKTQPTTDHGGLHREQQHATLPTSETSVARLSSQTHEQAPVRPTFAATKTPASAPRFKPMSTNVGHKSLATTKPLTSTPKHSTAKAAGLSRGKTPCTPKLTPDPRLYDSGLGSSLLSSPAQSGSQKTGWIDSCSQGVVAPTPGFASKRPSDMVSTRRTAIRAKRDHRLKL